MNRIVKKRIVREHREIIIQEYHRGTPVGEIAKAENVSSVTIYKYLIMWNVTEKRERIIDEGYRERRKSTTILPFEERISPEILEKMKDNSRVNEPRISRYVLKEDFYSLKEGF